MTLSSFKRSTFRDNVRYENMLVGNSAYNPYDFESIATITGNGSASTFTFSSIPSGYTHLQIRLIARGVRAFTTEQFAIRFNGDTGNNYAYHKLVGDGVSLIASATTSTNIIYPFAFPAATATANCFTAGIIDIYDFASTNKTKTIRALGGYDIGSGSPSEDNVSSGFWNNTAAITSVTVRSNGAFTTTSQFALYGIKAE
jgi:hypothetical protein